MGVDHRLGQSIRYSPQLIENVTAFLVPSHDEDAKSSQRTCSSFAFFQTRVYPAAYRYRTNRYRWLRGLHCACVRPFRRRNADHGHTLVSYVF